MKKARRQTAGAGGRIKDGRFSPASCRPPLPPLCASGSLWQFRNLTEAKVSAKRERKGERGAALLEFAIGATVFTAVVFAVLQFGVLLWTHNALTDAARRGARYAINQCDPSDGSCANSSTSIDRTKNMVVYGTPNPDAGAQPVVKGLTASNVQVTYSGFGVNAGSVTVQIVNYDFTYVVALFGSTLRMPAYSTTLTGENAGYAPPNL